MGTLLNDLENGVWEGRRLNLRPDVLRIKLKEKLQLSVLDFVYNHALYNQLIFYGGTCLRICFGMNRMSEDVDFETSGSFDKKDFASQIKDYFAKNMHDNSVTTHVPGKNISRIELRFPVLCALGLTNHEGENLIIKVEVNQIKDSYPIEFMTLSRDRFSMVIRHYDLPTLMAGKMLACLERVWEKKGVRVKGRDYYDLIWYMQKGIIPNATRLSAATQPYTMKEAFEKISQKVEKIKTNDLLADLGALFENVDFPKRWVAMFQEQFRQLYCHYVSQPLTEPSFPPTPK